MPPCHDDETFDCEKVGSPVRPVVPRLAACKPEPNACFRRGRMKRRSDGRNLDSQLGIVNDNATRLED